uniref:Max-binding protein MNT n=1 Tax=Aceria tosichella TaxID=561515 RepID=A0A6G1SQQ4_9ACAR
MSLSTLLEAAKYLDYLDSNKNSPQQQRRSPLHFQPLQPTQPTIVKKSARRQRSSRKDAANTMLAMSLPSSSGTIQMHQGVPIPMTSANSHHQAASLSSSFTESPLSSFASTALLCSKASGVTSASSSAASSLSSSDSSSSCGEIMMGDNDFNQLTSTSKNRSGHKFTHQVQSANNQPRLLNNFAPDSNQSFSHYIAATSAGPQLVTMTTTPSSAGFTSASAPIDSRLRAGHVIQAATNNANVSGGGFDPRHFSIATSSGIHRGGDATFGHLGTQLGSDNRLSGSPGTCPPLIMARVQPMILNSISPSAHQSIMAFQQQQQQQQIITASSPTSSTSSYSRHRELHKTLEKNRRAHLRHCFEILKAELPDSDCVDKKTSHINIIKSAIRYVLALRQQECEIDNELQRLIRVKNELTEKLSSVRNEHQVGATASTSQGNLVMPKSTSSPKPSSLQQQQNQPSSPPDPTVNHVKSEQASNQQPAAEQQLSFLLSQSKID